MKEKYLLVPVIIILLVTSGLTAQNVWINEIHYDNTGADADEFIEVALENPGSYNLADFSVILYNGNNGASYDTRMLDTFTAGAASGNFTLYWFNYTAAGAGIQNGAPDGMAIAYQGAIISGQFLSYEGTFMATDGPANGLTSAEIGVSESGTTPVGYSLQLGGSGMDYLCFTWQSESAATPGLLNNNQTIGSSVFPEPTNYPSQFDAEAVLFSVMVTWTDATGGQVPKAYLIKAGEENNIVLPADGVPEPDDLDFTDGQGAKNVIPGLQAFTFTGLKSNTTYYFEIFPYTNSGSDINYKTDGTPPFAQATTANIIVIIYKDFEDHSLDPWDTISLASDKGWSVDSSGYNHYAFIDGYQATEPCDDWLISPSMDFDQYIHETLSFKTAVNYSGPALQTEISTDYVTGTDPSGAEWTGITAALSPGSWTWTPTGDIDVSGFSGTNVHLAFHYLSDTCAAAWGVDDILISGDPYVGTGHDPARKSFGMSPNPAGEAVRISTGNCLRKEIRILDMVGKVQLTLTTARASETISLAGFAQGVYFVQVRENGSSAPGIQKLVIR